MILGFLGFLGHKALMAYVHDLRWLLFFLLREGWEGGKLSGLGLYRL